jgi:hypothetical protein
MSIQRILDDSKRSSRLFQWTGALSQEQLAKWISGSRVRWPGDLVELWRTVGGGTLFETETILSPFGNPVLGDDIQSVTALHRQRGLSEAVTLFHTGLGVSGVDESMVLVHLDGATYRTVSTHRTLDDWYATVLLSEYGSRYGLT